MTSKKSSTSSTGTTGQPAAGKGMPAKAPQPQRSLPDQHKTPEDDSIQGTLELPNDRDQSVDMTGGQHSALIEQAARDLDAGIKDTSKAPEMDRTYKKQKR